MIPRAMVTLLLPALVALGIGSAITLATHHDGVAQMGRHAVVVVTTPVATPAPSEDADVALAAANGGFCNAEECMVPRWVQITPDAYPCDLSGTAAWQDLPRSMCWIRAGRSVK